MKQIILPSCKHNIAWELISPQAGPATSHHSTQVNPPSIIQIKPAQTDQKSPWADCCFPSLSQNETYRLHMFSGGNAKLVLRVGLPKTGSRPTVTAPAGRSPSPPLASFFGASQSCLLHNVLIHQTKYRREVKTHELQTLLALSYLPKVISS